MKSILNLLLEISKLRDIKRKGITFYGVKNPQTTIDHMFRMAIMVLIFGQKKKINIVKAVKIALVHDLCKIYAGDITPYDGLLPKNKKERYEFIRKWPPHGTLKEKKKKYAEKFKKEYFAFKKLTLKLPKRIKKEIINLWLDFHKKESMEAKFVYQIGVVENLLEALERYKENKKFPTQPWWEHVEEVIDDPILLKFLKEIEKEELKGK